MRRNVIVSAVLTVLLAAGCIPSPDPVPPRPPVPTAQDAWVSALIADAQQGRDADITVIPRPQYDMMLTQLRQWAPSPAALVAQLRAVNPRWPVTASDLQTFTTAWCRVDVAGSTDFLLARIPGAGLATLPALNQLLGVLAQTCPGAIPQALDWTNQVFVHYTTTNQRAINAMSVPRLPPNPQRSAVLSAISGKLCDALHTGLSAKIAAKIRNSKANFLVTTALEVGMTFCPDAVQGIIA
ncbi:hypothetical protein ACFWY9_35550 [Amycolatopsis sp. NPDC059027]|uniref:hypothetical protein n=1 Tax=unclassified Amycolatopsis TaxID=2618356 RepID=UPI00366CB08B